MIAVGGKMTVFRFIKTKKKHLPSSGEVPLMVILSHVTGQTVKQTLNQKL